jgi:hypothetical protein
MGDTLPNTTISLLDRTRRAADQIRRNSGGRLKSDRQELAVGQVDRFQKLNLIQGAANAEQKLFQMVVILRGANLRANKFSNQS